MFDGKSGALLRSEIRDLPIDRSSANAVRCRKHCGSSAAGASVVPRHKPALLLCLNFFCCCKTEFIVKIYSPLLDRGLYRFVRPKLRKTVLLLSYLEETVEASYSD